MPGVICGPQVAGRVLAFQGCAGLMTGPAVCAVGCRMWTSDQDCRLHQGLCLAAAHMLSHESILCCSS
jgi:hypothetical protein